MSKKSSIARLLELPNRSFFLFGPRGVGKSTLLKSERTWDLQVDLLNSRLYLDLKQDPHKLWEMTGHLKSGSWILIDEVQKIPELLDEVHALYEERRLQFALSGSSARKLKRGGANLLAGRALDLRLFPFVYPEVSDLYSIDQILDRSCLPTILTDKDNVDDLLSSYVETYLKQELMEEGLIRKLDSFVRFLKDAATANGQIINVQNLARESGVGRTTVQSYYQILEDTLVGFFLPAYPAGIRKKETVHPKFYFFDHGVARSAGGLLIEDIDSVLRGNYFESFIVNQVRAYNWYSKKKRDLYFYNIAGTGEVDLVVETKRKTIQSQAKLICIEIKNSKKWDRRWQEVSLSLQQEGKQKVHAVIGVYRGKEILTQGTVQILPAEIFLQKLFAGDFF